jgi:hypothetical protein
VLRKRSGTDELFFQAKTDEDSSNPFCSYPCEPLNLASRYVLSRASDKEQAKPFLDTLIRNPEYLTGISISQVYIYFS